MIQRGLQQTRGFTRRLQDMLASRFGVAVAVGLVCLICLAGGLFLKSGADSVMEAQRNFDEAPIRNGFVALSDLKRLILVTQRAVLEETPSDKTIADFKAAVDIIFVRADTVKQIEQRTSVRKSETPASDRLFQIVNIADSGLAGGLADPAALLVILNASLEDARRELVIFADRMTQFETALLREQSDKLVRLTLVIGVVFSALAAFGTISLLLLRSEVLARQAREKAERRADFLAFFDPLTGLPNRVQFNDHMDQQLSAERPTTLLYVDLDEFKAINDTYGHAAGDAVLSAVGARLGEAADKAGGLAARLSGDEFAVALPEETTSLVSFFADGLLEAIGAVVEHDGHQLHPRCSIGAASAVQVGKGKSVEFAVLARAADFALYAAKENGRGRFAIYDEGLEGQLQERRAMLEELPLALRRRDLDVFLQPKVTLPAGDVYGFEALVRWRRNGRLVAPDAFIGLAEESGLVTEVDYSVLHQATALVARANAENATHLSVSVNLSALHFNGTCIVSEVVAALDASGLEPHLLTLEVTESIEIEDWDAVVAIMAELRAVGCRLSVDDFGSGYSSLAYLRKMVVDEIKIDRSLVDEIETASEARHVVKAILDLSTGLGMEVVVEGIETQAQARAIFEMGGLRGQGFLFGAPQPAHHVLWPGHGDNDVGDMRPSKAAS